MGKQILPDGILLVDKPTEWTSHDVCDFVRKRFHIKKVGHAGTLDPLATGLLVVLLGKATKLSMSLSAHEKEYEGKMEIGIETDSHDRQGKVLRTGSTEGVTIDNIRKAAERFQGEILQTPPMVSALKHQGTRLYELARQGITVPREGRSVIVRNFDLSRMEGNLISFSVTVSKGTYVRTLVHDLGADIGCFATLAELRRVRSGKFHLENAFTIEQLRELQKEVIVEKVIPLTAALSYADH